MSEFTDADVERVARAEYRHCQSYNLSMRRDFDDLGTTEQQSWLRCARVALDAYHETETTK